MIKKAFIIFMRDIQTSVRNFISLYILVVPIIFAVLINVFSPGINDTTVEILLLDGENPQQIEYFKQFAQVEIFSNLEEVENRVKRRDNIIAVLPDSKGDYYILTQGNEPDYVVDYVKKLGGF